MKSDLSRDTFDGAKHFTRVLMQQGRVTLDADHNEQVAILLNYLWTLAADVIGPAAAPVNGGGFRLEQGPDTAGPFTISKGRYYVDGLLVENDTEDLLYSEQADFPLLADDPFQPNATRPEGPLLAYLDVWERHITPVEDALIREVGLGGPDTCNRAKLVWQVRLAPVPQARILTASQVTALKGRRTRMEKSLAKETDPEAKKKLQAELDAINAELERAAAPAAEGPQEGTMDCQSVVDTFEPLGTGLLAARLDPGALPPDPCVMPPDSRYRGAENQLYRVEIHEPGAAGVATFKWSRDNGSVVTALVNVNGNDLEIARGGFGGGFDAGAWAELSDETRELQGKPGVLVKIAKVGPGVLTIDPASSTDAGAFWATHGALPKVRRWDQIATGDVTLVSGAVRVPVPGKGADPWIDLEDGLQVRFTVEGTYRTGDYWLIPARVATGTIDWPDLRTPPGASDQPPHGVRHHFAPLGFVAWNADTKAWNVDNNCRCDFPPLCGMLRPQ
jgi:hypothetical protein